MTEFSCNQQIVAAARRRMTGIAWDYVMGAALSETTLRRNRYAIDSYAFLPRVLRDVSMIDTSATALGQSVRLPVLLSPMGSMNLITLEGVGASARAAERRGLLQAVSSVSGVALEETAAASSASKIFQLYIRGDMDWVRDYLDRVRSAGYIALMLTVDAPYYGLRERQLLQGWKPSTLNDPGFRYQAGMTWEKMAAISRLWGGPMILKGIATAADARLAVEHGVAAICVSNHGGRDLDHGRGTLEMLPEIVETAGRHAEIWVDGGFVRGADIVKALCLGARLVGVGRLQAWGLGADGEEGLVRALEILEDEIRNTMGLIGAPRIADLGPDYLARVTPLGPTHETSAFRHLGEKPLR
ncbi:MAG TPA: alpha-hydroxy acid oxidase [Beijerinckiaceae bacterium]|nr:alpha-hydroxy acid oxidase [Beijerinckiaceae bacterium]